MCESISNEDDNEVPVDVTRPLLEGENTLIKVYNIKADSESNIPENVEKTPDLIIMGDIDETYERTNTARVINLRVLYNTFDEETGETTYAQLTADYGEINYQNKNFEAWGNVEVIKDRELRLETTRIRWINSQEKMETEAEEPVTIYRSDGTVSLGKNLVINKNMEIVMQEALTETPRSFDETEEFIGE